MRRRERIEPTHDWDQLILLFEWPEQEEYELIRQPILFGTSVTERSEETGVPERTLYLKIERFENEGPRGLYSSESAKRRLLPQTIRKMIVDLKAEHPPFNNNEIRNIVYVRTGRRLGDHTVARVLEEEVVPLKLSRLFEPYHEIQDSRERRWAVVALHLDGWSVKATASYLKISNKTVYRVLGRWLAEGEAGLEDRPPGRPKGVRKVDLATMNDIRRMQENPELGAFRIHAALEQKRGGIEISARTVGRIMAVHRSTYGLDKPKRSPHQKRLMPFIAHNRHQFWTADVRYLKTGEAVEEQLYVISILENYSRKILASSVARRQDLTAYLPVLYSAIERYGSPETLVTDGGAVFRANPALSIYNALNIDKQEIERRQAWQSLIETTFGIQRRMADYHFAKAQSFEEAVEIHGRWISDYNSQRHWAHEDREDGRHSPEAVLGFYTATLRYHPEDLRRAFFSVRFSRILDVLGYARLMHWRVLGHEGLAKRNVELWLGDDALTVEFDGQALSRYEADYHPGRGGLKQVRYLELYESVYTLPQPRLFGLEETLGDGWLKVLKLDRYNLRKTGQQQALQEALFPYSLDAVGREG